MKKPFLRIMGLAFGVGVLLALTGCWTTRPEAGPLSDGQLRDYFSRARDPRRFWITVYQSKDGPVFTGANRLHPDQVAFLPFASRGSDCPIVEAESRYKTAFVALFDTSSPENWMDYPTALRVKATPLGPPSYDLLPTHVQDPVVGYMSVVDKVILDTLHIESALVAVRADNGPLRALARGQFKPEPEAVIGVDLLKTFQFVQFDFAGRQVVLSTTLPYTPNSSNLVASVPLRTAGGAFAARGIVAGEQASVLFDVAGDYELAMANPPEDGTVKHLSVDDLVFRNVSVVPAQQMGMNLPEYPRIGRKLLSRFRVTFDIKKKMVHFEKP